MLEAIGLSLEGLTRKDAPRAHKHGDFCFTGSLKSLPTLPRRPYRYGALTGDPSRPSQSKPWLALSHSQVVESREGSRSLFGAAGA